MAFLDRPAKKTRWFPVVIFLLLGSAAIIFSGIEYINAYAQTKWPTVKGSIVYSAIRIGKDKGTYYCPDISWTYQIGGYNYTSSNDPFCSSRSAAQAKVAKFPLGAWVNVSYNPQDPSESTIEPGVSRVPIEILIIGIIFIVAGLFNL